VVRISDVELLMFIDYRFRCFFEKSRIHFLQERQGEFRRINHKKTATNRRYNREGTEPIEKNRVHDPPWFLMKSIPDIHFRCSRLSTSNFPIIKGLWTAAMIWQPFFSAVVIFSTSSLQ